jgi:hypothetical protein
MQWGFPSDHRPRVIEPSHAGLPPLPATQVGCGGGLVGLAVDANCYATHFRRVAVEGPVLTNFAIP